MKKSYKNVNLGNKKSQTSIKETRKCKVRRQKAKTQCKKRLKNENLSYKKSQTNEK